MYCFRLGMKLIMCPFLANKSNYKYIHVYVYEVSLCIPFQLGLFYVFMYFDFLHISSMYVMGYINELNT